MKPWNQREKKSRTQGASMIQRRQTRILAQHPFGNLMIWTEQGIVFPSYLLILNIVLIVKQLIRLIYVQAELLTFHIRI